MLKKFFSLSLLCICFLIGSSLDAFAAEDSIEIGTSQKVQESYVDSNGTHYIMTPLSEAEQLKEIKTYLKKEKGIKSFDHIVIEAEKSSLSPDVVDQDKIGSVTKKIDLGRVGGQTGSVCFDDGGFIYWQDGGATTNVSFSIGGAGYSMAVSIGYKASGVTGYGMQCLPGVDTIMGLERTVKFTRWHVHGWDEVSNTNINQYVNTQETKRRRFYNCLK